MRITTLAALLPAIALSPSPALSQGWPDDPAVTRFPWGSANVLVIDEGACGLLLWAETTRHSLATPRHTFLAFFAPDRVRQWLEPASALLRASAPPPAAATALETPPLLTGGGAQVVLRRERQGERWHPASRFYFVSPLSQQAWYIEAPVDQAQRLMNTMFERAVDHSEPLADGMPCVTPADPQSAPKALTPFEMLTAPHGLLAMGEPADVWLSLLILPDGRVDPDSVRVLSATRDVLAREALREARKVHYRPATRHGLPMRARVYVHLYFDPS